MHPNDSTFIPMARPATHGLIERSFEQPADSPIARSDVTGDRSTDPMLLRDTRRLSCLLNTMLLVVMAIAITVVLGTIAMMLIEASFDARMLNLTLSLLRGGVVLGILWGLTRLEKTDLSSVGLSLRNWGFETAWGAVFILPTYMTFLIGIGVLWAIYPQGWAILQENPQQITQELPKLHPVLLCGSQCWIAIYEEAVFRGYFLTRIRRVTGSAVLAVIISSALFAAPHATNQKSVVVVPLFFIGALWACMVLWRRSLIPSIIAHAAFNSINLLVIYYQRPDWQ